MGRTGVPIGWVWAWPSRRQRPQTEAEWKLVDPMHAVKVSELLSIPSLRDLVAPPDGRWYAFVAGYGLSPLSVRRLAWEALVPVMAGVIMAMMVLLGGLMAARTTAYVVIPPSSSTVDPVTGVDPRDGVVANGWVTPWMERINTPDPSVTP